MSLSLPLSLLLVGGGGVNETEFTENKTEQSSRAHNRTEQNRSENLFIWLHRSHKNTFGLFRP